VDSLPAAESLILLHQLVQLDQVFREPRLLVMEMEEQMNASQSLLLLIGIGTWDRGFTLLLFLLAFMQPDERSEQVWNGRKSGLPVDDSNNKKDEPDETP